MVRGEIYVLSIQFGIDFFIHCNAFKVVANAVLNPATSPVAAAFFESLANLEAEYVRYGEQVVPFSCVFC